MADERPRRALYHYTAPTTSHLGNILASGLITTTESNLSAERRNAGPPVVWLTDSADPSEQLWASGPALDATGAETDDPTILSPAIKAAAVLVVELPVERVHHWPEWSRAHGIDPVIEKGLAETGGDPGSWWVTEEPISRWDVTALVIAPFTVGDLRGDYRQFAGDDLGRLFQSAGARRALNLIPAVKRSHTT